MVSPDGHLFPLVQQKNHFKVINNIISKILVTQSVWLPNKGITKVQILFFKISPKLQHLVQMEDPTRNSQ